jgi:hypothetical protein
MKEMPAFFEEAAAIAERLASSEHAEWRASALKFVADLTIQSHRLAQMAVENLDDPQPIVQAAAADAVGSLGIIKPPVIQKLRALLDLNEIEHVRAAGLRNLVRLKPIDPEIQKLVDSKLNDHHAAVRFEAIRAAKARQIISN